MQDCGGDWDRKNREDDRDSGCRGCANKTRRLNVLDVNSRYAKWLEVGHRSSVRLAKWKPANTITRMAYYQHKITNHATVA
jgi:hypothetical protein